MQRVNFHSFFKFSKMFRRKHFRKTGKNSTIHQMVTMMSLLQEPPYAHHPGGLFQRATILVSNPSFCTQHKKLILAVALY